MTEFYAICLRAVLSVLLLCPFGVCLSQTADAGDADTATATATATATDISFLEEQAKGAIRRFQAALKAELTGAMRRGGPMAAIEVCNERAPQIGEQITLEEGVQVRRTSLKVRNSNNAPDPQEHEILKAFEARKADGEPVATMTAHRLSDGAFTWMKPIPMTGVCASCHGAHVAEPLMAHIRKFYPDDMATGFNPGDIRGAFVVTIRR